MFYSKFKPDELLIKDFKNWVIVLRQKQITLAAAVIILKREVPSLGDVLPEELSELPEVITWYEIKCREYFGAEKFNYYAAMMKDNFVHFHAFPRYSNEVVFSGITWKDEFWPKPVNLIDVQTDAAVLMQILIKMK